MTWRGGWGTETTHCLLEVSGKGSCLLILALASACKRQTDRVLGLCLSCVPPLPWALWPQNCGTVESVELAVLMSKWRNWGPESQVMAQAHSLGLGARLSFLTPRPGYFVWRQMASPSKMRGRRSAPLLGKHCRLSSEAAWSQMALCPVWWY